MSDEVHVVLSADRRVLPGLHVAAYSILASQSSVASRLHIHLFTDSLTAEDVALLKKTLAMAHKPFELELQTVPPEMFARFPSMRGSWAPYFRLLAPEIIPASRMVYLDVDTICYLDMDECMEVDLKGCPAGFVAEAMIQKSPDRALARFMGPQVDGPYLNSGVMIVDCDSWRSQRITGKCIEYLRVGPADYHEQSAMNCVLHSNWCVLEPRFNFIANWRKNWPALKAEALGGKLVHFLDKPKPWDLLGEWLHPQYHLWRAMLDQTAMKDFRSWHDTPARRFPRTRNARIGYKKAIKDRLLFAGYKRGWLKRVKGVPNN